MHGNIRRTGSDDLKTCYREEIHGEKFCSHASNATDRMKEIRIKSDERKEGKWTESFKLGVPAPGMGKDHQVSLSWVLYGPAPVLRVDTIMATAMTTRVSRVFPSPVPVGIKQFKTMVTRNSMQ